MRKFVYDREKREVIEVDMTYRGAPQPRIHIISDFKQPVVNPLNGQTYDSRRHYEDEVRAHGCRVVGNDCQDQVDWGTKDAPPEPVDDKGISFDWSEPEGLD